MSLFHDRNPQRLSSFRPRSYSARRRLLVIEGLETRRVLTGNSELVVSVAEGTGPGTLYEMIQVANAQPGPDRITFASDIVTVRPSASLPWISDALVIDGANRVTLDGSGSPSDGLMINGSGVQIINLTVGNYTNGSGIFFLGASNGKVQGSRLGTDQAGLVAMPNIVGITVHRSSNMVIGTEGDGVSDNLERNIISGNLNHGVAISETSSFNRISGNYIGTTSDGTTALPNLFFGVVIGGQSTNNILGTNGDGFGDDDEGNIVSGNSSHGIIIGVGADNNVIAGNYVGVDATGNAALPNGAWTAVLVDPGVLGTRIGTDGDGLGDIAERNIISGSPVHGLVNLGSNGRIAGNYIGTNADGTFAIPNRGFGIGFETGHGNIIGTDGDGSPGDANEGNLISGNSEWGIFLGNSSQNRISGNRIGTDATGTFPIANRNGIALQAAANNVVGTDGDGSPGEANEGNLISGNLGHAIIVSDTNTLDNVIAGNLIGTDASGMNLLRNEGWANILVTPGPIGTRIGTNGDGISDAQERNVISGGNYNGIASSASQSIIAGNYIGTNRNGTQAIPNRTGIWLYNGAQNNIIGTNGDSSPGDAMEGNLISGNFEWGVIFAEANTQLNRLSGNRIGTDADGMSAVPNLNAIAVWTGASNNFIGTNGDGLGDAQEGNLISGNTGHAMYMASAGTNNNTVAGNLIGTDATGSSKLSNQAWTNIFIEPDPSGTLIGTNGDGVSDTFERNIISGSSGYGIAIRASHTTIAGNYIGTNKEGTAAIPNAADGVFLFGGAKHSIVGVNSDGSPGEVHEGNLISGNSSHGLQIHGADTKYNRVAGNLIGTSADGQTAMGNLLGVGIAEGASNNNVGGSVGARNVISGNLGYGVRIEGSSNDNLIQSNFIGTTKTGQIRLSNTNGVGIYGGSNNIIGTDGDGRIDDEEGNVISGNSNAAIILTGSNVVATRVAGNVVGTSPDGNSAVPNHGDWSVWISQGAKSTIFGTNGDGVSDALERNVVSGNTSGIVVVDPGTDGTIIAGNIVGLNANGDSPLGNQVSWITVAFLNGAGPVRFGTNGDGVSDDLERNIVSANTGFGVGMNTDGNTVAGNYIGTDIYGTQAMGNSFLGIVVFDTASNNVIGTNGDGNSDAAEANVISANLQGGIGLRNIGSANNRVSGNYIGTDHSGTLNLGNQGYGIAISNNTVSNLIGTDGNGVSDDLEANVISGNLYGVLVIDSNSNRISGNKVGTDASGQFAIPNSLLGIEVSNSQWTVIGANGDNSTGESNEGNIISGNDGPGIAILGTYSKNTSVVGNTIGSALGIENDLGNNGPGIYVDDQATETILGGPNAPFGNFIAYNTIGIRLDGPTANLKTLRHNRFLSNDSIAIDAAAAGSSPNDNGDTDALRNAPVITSVRQTDQVLIVEGFARPGTEFDLYQTSASTNGFGQGQTFLARVFEGGLQDQDDTVGTYDASSVAGIPVGTDTTNRFRFVLPLDSLQNPIGDGEMITAIATDPTSEFSNQATVETSSLSDVERGPKSLTLSNRTIAELMAPGTIVGFLSSTGYELRPSYEYTYSLVDGDGSADNAAFAIVDNRLISSQTFDHESQSSYSIRLRVTDPENQTFEQSFVIEITDAQEDGSGPYIVRANVSSDGGQANERSQDGALSADGRYLAYSTKSSNTDPEKTDDLFDILRKDLVTGQTLLVSRGNLGNAYYPSISADGRYVVYGSAYDLGLGDSNLNQSIFVADTVAGTTQLVTSYQHRGIEGVGNQNQAPYAISADGRYVAFSINNSAPGETFRDGIYVKDLLTGNVDTVVQETGVYFAAISADGTHVAVSRGDGGLVAADVVPYSVYNLRTGSRSDVAPRGDAQTHGWQASLSGDGKYLTFMRNWEIYLHDTTNGSTRKISLHGFDSTDPDRSIAVAPSIDTNGKLIAYYGSVVSSGVRNRGLFLYDIESARTGRFEETFDANSTFSNSMTMSIAANGSKAAIFSDRTDLVPDDTNGFRDMFVIDLVRPMVDMTLSESAFSESTPVGSVLGDLNAYDAFSNTISAEYSLVSGSGDTDNELFEIVQGQLKLKQPLDYESSPSHWIRIRATDAQGRFIERIFSISVLDVNEYDVTVPTDSDPTVNRIQTTDAVGTTVGITAYAVDLDGSNNAITYSLDESAGGLLNIDPQSGVVQVAGSLLGVASDTLSITVRATSSDGSSQTTSFAIQVIGNVSIGGTSGNDQFVATQLGMNQWSIQRNGTVVFNGFVSTGGSLRIDGAEGTDTLTVAGTPNQDSFAIYDSTIVLNGFTVTGASIESRSVWGMAMGDTFTIHSSIQSIAGGDGQDRFVMASQTAIVDNLDAGNSYDTLDYSLLSGPIAYTLGSSSAPGIAAMSRIDSLVASSGSDTLIGANVLTDWTRCRSDQRRGLSVL